MGVVVHIDKFSGPMALLLHLIRREEMDIFDININEITRQYLESIRAMKKLNLELAGDFIAMAATLIQIKSSMLLPQYNEEGEVVEQEDPRKDLVRRLMEYQMYQEGGQNLYRRSIVGRDLWLRGRREEIKVDDEGIELEEGSAIYNLIASYRSAIKNMKKAVHRVAHSLQSVADRILEMRSKLVKGTTTQLTELMKISSSYPDKKGQLLITFLSLLELAKIGLVKVFQSQNFEDIHIETHGEINEKAISNIEKYESQAQDVIGGGDIWLSDEDRKIDMTENRPTTDLPLFQAATSEEEELVQAATDEEIENEEKLYGE